jgi:hypothetical protein
MRRIAIGSALTLVLFGLLNGCAGSVCEQAISKLEGECALGSGVTVPLGPGTGECRNDSDDGIFSECAAGCVLDSACEDITDKDQDNGYFDCLADCPD